MTVCQPCLEGDHYHCWSQEGHACVCAGECRRSQEVA